MTLDAGDDDVRISLVAVPTSFDALAGAARRWLSPGEAHRPAAVVLLILLGLSGARPGVLDGQTVPRTGDWSLGFVLFDDDGGNDFGVDRMMTDRLKLGIVGSVANSTVEDEVEAPLGDDATVRSYSVGPVVTWYGTRDLPVSPFLRAAASVGWANLVGTSSGIREIASLSLAGSVAAGAEWYPIRWLGVSAHTGLQYVRSNEEIVSDSDRLVRDRVVEQFRTFRSGLVVSYYFR